MTIRSRRILLTAALLPVMILTGILITFYSLLYLSLPNHNGQLTAHQLNRPVEITIDAKGLPQIWAETDHDGYFAFGYLHASDRLFQMELIRRVAHGRLSEMLGDRTMDEDIRQRKAGHARMARAALSTMTDENRTRLQAYVDGINAYYHECDALPIEFYLLQIDFEQWTVHDCLTILSFQTWFSDALLNKDILFLKIAQKVGAQKGATILTGYPDWAPVSVNRSKFGHIGDTGTTVRRRETLSSNERKLDRTTVGIIGSIRDRVASVLIDEQLTPMLGTNSSNAWAVGPSRSESGYSLFASDPHLDVTRIPGFWYLAGLHIRQSNTDVMGISTPGLPMIVMGHTGQSAFAFTAAGIDMSDVFREELNPADSNQYVFKNETLNFNHVVESIYVAGVDPPTVVDIRSTQNGPVFYDDDSTGEIFSLNWAGFDADLDAAITAGFDLHQTKSFEQFRVSVTMLGALNANWIYADAKGHIGYQLGAPLPMQRLRDSRFPRNGSKDQNDWRGYYPMNLSPHIIDPHRGWVANCNNRPDRNSTLYQYAGNFFVDRIMRLEQLMADKEKYNIDDMARFQRDRTDSYLLRWRQIAVALLNELNEQEWAARFSSWDGSTPVNSHETLLMQLFLNVFKENTFKDELGDLHKQIRIIWLDRMYQEGDSTWFDDLNTENHVETAKEVALLSMRQAIELSGESTWGERHSLTVRHPLAAVPILGYLLDLTFGPYSQPGTAGTLNASFFRVTDDYDFETFVAPSWRMLLDFKDINSTRVVLPAGNSGNPASPYFVNFIDEWRSGEYWTVPFEYSEVKKRTVSALILSP